jgi:integrase/recombinase XerC/integrase/recombinase XerD
MDSISQSMEAFLRIAGARSRRTKTTYKTALGHFQSYLQDNTDLDPETAPVADLSLDQVREFAAWLAHDYRTVHDRPLSETSRATYMAGLEQYLYFLVTNGKLTGVTLSDYSALSEQLKKMAKFRRDPIEKRLPEKEIITALLETVQQVPPKLQQKKISETYKRRLTVAWLRDQAIVLTLYSSGVRVGELVSLRRGDLDHTSQGVFVKGKGNRQRFVRFSQQAWQAIVRYLEARQDEVLGGTSLAPYPVFCRHSRSAGTRRLPLSTRSVQNIIKTLAERAEIMDKFNLTPHSFRHFFATVLLQKTHDLAMTQDALGHSDPSTTRIYAKTSRKALIEAHREVFDDNQD